MYQQSRNSWTDFKKEEVISMKQITDDKEGCEDEDIDD